MATKLCARYILKNKYNFYLDVGLPSFAGWCRYGSNERDHIKYITINGALSCKQQCLDTEACSAFSYQPEVKNNCNLYQGGPYTKGDGRAGTTCYIMPKGKLLNAISLCASS